LTGRGGSDIDPRAHDGDAIGDAAVRDEEWVGAGGREEADDVCDDADCSYRTSAELQQNNALELDTSLNHADQRRIYTRGRVYIGSHISRLTA
jgi:hypothetical protein